MLGNVKASAWDMDGCVYRYPTKFNDHCDEMAVLALFKTLDELPAPNNFQEFKRRAQSSYLESGSPVYEFSQTYKIPFDALNATYHDLLSVDHLIPMTRLPKAFTRAVRAGHNVHLATHSHMNFTKRALPQLGLSSVFDITRNVLTLEQRGFKNRKCQSPDMVIETAAKLKTCLSEMAFVEDTLKNFDFVKDHDHRIRTVLVTWGNTPTTRPANVDIMVRDPLEAIAALRPKRRSRISMTA